MQCNQSKRKAFGGAVCWRWSDPVWHDLLVAVSLMMVIEGILPFVSPQQLRRGLLMLAEMDDGVLRLGGLTTMLLGVGLLYLVN